MEENTKYNRLLELTNNFNIFWNNALKTENEDYLSGISVENLIELKKALNNINNFVTLMVTLRFIEQLRKIGVISFEQAENMKDEVNSVHPNTNGFDVRYPLPEKTKSEEKNIVAEVKCNIPVDGNKFGANQKKGIYKDLKGILDGKNKEKNYDHSKYHKFMVMLDVNGVREAMANIINDFNKENTVNLVELSDNKIDFGHIYIVYINLSDTPFRK